MKSESFSFDDDDRKEQIKSGDLGQTATVAPLQSAMSNLSTKQENIPPATSPAASARASITSPTTHIRAKTVIKRVIIFDWDDTLLPSHDLHRHNLRPKTLSQADEEWRNKLQHADNARIVSKLRHLEHILVDILQSALRMVGCGCVIVLTNAERGWVELSCSTFLPKLWRVLQSGCRVLSARSTFERQYPLCTIEWKRRAVKQVLEELCAVQIDISSVSYLRTDISEANENMLLQDKTNVQAQTPAANQSYPTAIIDQLQVISFGDSLVERQAVIDVTQCIAYGSHKDKIKSVLTKSIKLLSTPSIELLIDEWTTIQQSFSMVMQHPNHMDFQIEMKQNIK